MQVDENTKTSQELLSELSFTVIDLETTGGNQQKDCIIEIGLIQIHHLKIIKQVSFLINPEIPIPEFIQKLTGIKDSDVEEAPIFTDVANEIINFIGESILVAHNTSFDIPFLNAILQRSGFNPLKNPALCTNLMTKFLIPQLLTSNLNYMSRIFHLSHHKAHRALDDAQAAAELLLKYFDIFIQKKISKVNSLYYPKNKFELDRIHFKSDVPKDEIQLKINALTIPFTVMLKSHDGIVQFHYPACGNNLEEKKFLCQIIEATTFELATLRLTGPLIHGIIELSHHYSKMSNENQNLVINKMIEFHQLLEFESEIKNKNRLLFEDDFIITNHLIPDQFFVAPMRSLQKKMDLIFRFPGHQSKLVQYINSRSHKMNTQTLVEDKLPLYVQNLLFFMIKKYSGEILLIKRPLSKINWETTLEMIKEFSHRSPNQYHFPENYL